MFKTLTILSLSAIIFLSQPGCKFGVASKKSTGIKEFEGIITYHEIVKNSDSSFNVDDTVQLFYSNGNYVGIHSAKSSQFHVVKDYYFEDEPLRLFLLNNSDTLHQIDLNFPIEKLDGFKVKKISDQILSRKCENIELNISYLENGSVTYTDVSFVFSRGYLEVDKGHFENWNLGFFNKVIDESEAFYLKFKTTHFDSSHKRILSSKTYDIISVKEELIESKIFKIDSGKIKRAK